MVTHLYIYRNSSPYLKIKLKDKYVFINGEKPDITKEYYEEINEAIKRWTTLDSSSFFYLQYNNKQI